MHVTLHLGVHRTATTSFQGYLNANKAHLRASGIEQWGPERTRDGLMEGLMGQVQGRSPRSLRAAERSLGRLRMEQSRLEQRGVERLMVSEENLIGGMRPNLRRKHLYHDAGARLALLKPAFAARCDAIAITIRQYDTYWASVIGHRVLMGEAMPTEGGLDALVTQPRRWRQVITDVANVFPGVPLHVFLFERFAGRPDRQLSILAPELGQPPTQNARVWHNRGRCSAQMVGILAERQGADSAISLGKSHQRWHPFSDLQTEALVAQYEEDLRWLRAGADGLVLLEEGRDETIDSQVRRNRRQSGRERQRPDGRQSAIA